MKPSDLAAWLFLALAWGCSFLVIVKVAAAFGWAGATSLRALIAGGGLILIARATGRRLDFSCGWGRLAVVGATTVAIQLAGLSWGTPRIGTAAAAILVATIPIFTMVFGRLAGIEPMTGARAAGVGLGFLGVVALVGFPAAPATLDYLAGCAALIACSVGAAIGSLYAAARLSGTGAHEITAGSFLAGGMMTAPLLLLAPPPGPPGLADWGWLLVLALGMSAATYVTFFRLVARIGPTRAISSEFAVTLVAVAIGALFLDERLSAFQLAGAASIALGCALVLGLVPGMRRG